MKCGIRFLGLARQCLNSPVCWSIISWFRTSSLRWEAIFDAPDSAIKLTYQGAAQYLEKKRVRMQF